MESHESSEKQSPTQEKKRGESSAVSFFSGFVRFGGTFNLGNKPSG
jgi:hypothetical protein